MFLSAAARSARLFGFLVLSAAWLALTLFLVHSLESVWPAARAKEPVAVLLALVFGLSLAHFVLALFYIPPKASGPVFLGSWRPLAGRLVFLPLAFGCLKEGPALAGLCSPEERLRLLQSLSRQSLSLAGRLSYLLNGRSPLELALIFGRRLPRPLSWPALLVDSLIYPAKLLTRLWGLSAFSLWSSAAGPEPDPFLSLQRARAWDLAWRFQQEGQEPPQEPEAWREAQERLRRRRGLTESPEALAGQPPAEAVWLSPRWRGLYLDLPVALAARSLEELYDMGPAEPPELFHCLPAGREARRWALLRAEARWLRGLAAEGAVVTAVDGRPWSWYSLALRLRDLEDEAEHLARRLASHQRRCRSAHLVLASRLARGWPERLSSLLSLIHFCEWGQAQLRSSRKAALTELIEALDSVELPPDLPFEADLKLKDTAGAAELAFALKKIWGAALERLLAAEDYLDAWAYGGAPALEAPPSAALAPVLTPELPPEPEPRPRIYSPAAALGCGPVRTLAAAFLLALLLWQGQTLSRGASFDPAAWSELGPRDFWSWQALAAGPEQGTLWLERLEAEPLFLDETLDWLYQAGPVERRPRD